MTEVISVEVDGEVDDDGRFSPEDRRPPRWGLPVAIAVAGVLLLAVLVIVVFPALTGAGGSDTEAAETRVSEGKTHERTRAAMPTDPRIDTAEKALAAWGQFGVTGNLVVLEGLYDKEGPQYRALMDEAPRLAAVASGQTPYRVTLSNPAVTSADSRQATVAGTVVWSRRPELDQAFAWQVVLHPSPDGRWVLWTVQNT